MPDFDIKKASERINKIKNSQKNRKPRTESRPKRWKEGIYNKLQVLKFLVANKLKATVLNVKTLYAETGIFGVNKKMTLTDNEIDIDSGNFILQANSGTITLEANQNIKLDAKAGTVTIIDSSPQDLTPSFVLKSTNSGPYGPQWYTRCESSSPAVNDILFFENNLGKNDADQDVGYVTKWATIQNVADGTECSDFLINTMANGTARNIIKGTGTTDNEVNVDIGYGSDSTATIAGDLDIDGDTITTAGNIELATGGSGNVTIDAAGDIALEAAGGDITMDAPLTITNTATPQLKLIDQAGEYAQFGISGSGDLTITTEGSGSTNSDINLTADGNINLNIAAGELIALSNLAASFAFNHANRRFRLYGSDGGGDYLQLTSGADGASTISTTDGDGSVGTLTLDANGDIVIDCDAGKDISLTENTGTYTPASANHATPKHYVDSKRMAVAVDQISYRMAVNNWYIGNNSLGTTVTAADFAYNESHYALYTTTSAVKLKAWKWVGGMSSSSDYEMMLYDLTVPSNNTATALTVAQIGSTQSATITNRWYTLGQDDLDYDLAAGHQLYLLIRFTSGTGTKYSYGNFSAEMEII